MQFKRFARPIFYMSKSLSRNSYEMSLVKLVERYRMIAKDTPEPPILVIGSGGTTEQIVKKLNPNSLIVSLDIDQSRNPNVVADGLKMPFKDGQFQSVYLLEVLEHTPFPNLLIEEIRRVMAERSILFVSTPFLLGIHDRPYDYFRFTEYGLNHLLRYFDERTVIARNGPLTVVFTLLSRLILAEKFHTKLVGVFFSILAFGLKPLLIFGDWSFPDNSLCTGYVAAAVKNKTNIR